MTKSVPALTVPPERVRESLQRLERQDLERRELSHDQGDDRRPGILDAIRAALGRLDDGTYGACTSCGQEIEAARLEAIPYAERCLSCQRTSEPRR
jgi:RNA polymerase-binding transcription factor DksA